MTTSFASCTWSKEGLRKVQEYLENTPSTILQLNSPWLPAEARELALDNSDTRQLFLGRMLLPHYAHSSAWTYLHPRLLNRSSAPPSSNHWLTQLTAVSVLFCKAVNLDLSTIDVHRALNEYYKILIWGLIPFWYWSYQGSGPCLTTESLVPWFLDSSADSPTGIKYLAGNHSSIRFMSD